MFFLLRRTPQTNRIPVSSPGGPSGGPHSSARTRRRMDLFKSGFLCSLHQRPDVEWLGHGLVPSLHFPRNPFSFLSCFRNAAQPEPERKNKLATSVTAKGKRVIIQFSSHFLQRHSLYPLGHCGWNVLGGVGPVSVSKKCLTHWPALPTKDAFVLI